MLSHATIINIHKEPEDIRLGVYSLLGLIVGSGCSVRWVCAHEWPELWERWESPIWFVSGEPRWGGGRFFGHATRLAAFRQAGFSFFSSFFSACPPRHVKPLPAGGWEGF